MVDVEIHVDVQKTAVAALVQARAEVVVGHVHAADARHVLHPLRKRGRHDFLAHLREDRREIAEIGTFRLVFVQALVVLGQLVHRRETVVQRIGHVGL